MRLNFTLFFLLLLSFNADAQKLTGIWRGYFSSSNAIYSDKNGAHEETYKFEIQIDQQSNNSLKGVTYSYKSSVFFGKAELNGIYTPSSKNLIIKETKMVELKIGDKSEPCLMTCYLEYSKIGKLEVLEGTFISVNVKDKGDCGNGKIYLERVTTSDFKKEDFLTNKKPDDSAKSKPATTLTDKPNNKPAGKPKPKPVFAPPVITPNTKKDNLVIKPVPKPHQQNPVTGGTIKVIPPPVKKTVPKTGISKNKPTVKEDKPIVSNKPVERVQEQPVNTQKQEQTIPEETQPKKIPVPRLLLERENKLVTTITTSEEMVEIKLYDNGEIDNDTITVYHNNELVVSHARLSTIPITFRIKCSKTDSRHELVIVAENLGDIPPNTALMVVTAGNMKEGRHEITLASDEKRNAKVVINYVPKL